MTGLVVADVVSPVCYLGRVMFNNDVPELGGSKFSLFFAAILHLVLFGVYDRAPFNAMYGVLCRLS